MRRLGARLDLVRAALPEPPPPEPPPDFSRLTAAHKQRLAELQPRWLAHGLEGLTDCELDEIIAIQEVLFAAV